MRWQHLRSSRRYYYRYCIGIAAANKFARFTAGREGTRFCLYVSLSDQPAADRSTYVVDQNGSLQVPVEYDMPECLSVDKDVDSDTYRLMEATEWQIENELAHRNTQQPTGWFQKSPVITVRKEDLVYLKGSENSRFYSREVFEPNPAILLIAADTYPGQEWKDRTHALKKCSAFGVSSKYKKYVGLMRDTQLRAIRTEAQVNGYAVPCYRFLAPDHNDAVTGRIISESLEPVIRLDVKREAEELLSTVREYMSHTDETASFTSRISTIIDMMMRDKAAADALMEEPAMKALLQKSVSRRANS